MKNKFEEIMTQDIANFVKDLRTPNGTVNESNSLGDIAKRAYFEFEELKGTLNYMDVFDCEDFVDAAYDYIEWGE